MRSKAMQVVMPQCLMAADTPAVPQKISKKNAPSELASGSNVSEAMASSETGLASGCGVWSHSAGFSPVSVPMNCFVTVWLETSSFKTHMAGLEDKLHQQERDHTDLCCS